MSQLVAVGILSALASAGFTALVLKTLQDGNTQILSGDKLIATIPSGFDQGVIELQKLNKPLDRARIFVKRYTIGAGVITKPSQPTATITNPFSRTRLYTMTIRPDPTNGKVHLASELTYNGNELLYHNDAGDLTDSDSVNLPLPNEGLTLQDSQNINLFFWTDGTGCSVTIYALMGVK